MHTLSLNEEIFAIERFSTYVNVEKIHTKGTDASNQYDEEPNDKERNLIEMDDDEIREAEKNVFSDSNSSITTE